MKLLVEKFVVIDVLYVSSILYKVGECKLAPIFKLSRTLYIAPTFKLIPLPNTDNSS